MPSILETILIGVAVSVVSGLIIEAIHKASHRNARDLGEVTVEMLWEVKEFFAGIISAIKEKIDSS